MILEDLESGATEACDESSAQDDRPAWLDIEKFKRGQQFFQKHIVVATLAMHCSLVVGFSLVNLLNALVFTQKSNTPGKAMKRYLDTFLHIYKWHTGDVWNNPDDPAYQSLRHVREMHHKVAENLREQTEGHKRDTSVKAVHRKFESNVKSAHHSEVYLSQYDMALVQVGFMGAITMYPLGFGLVLSKGELEDYIHFWRGIGYILGVKDEFNVCQGNYEETFNVCKEIEETVLMEGLKNPPPEFEPMADSYCNGVNGFLRMPLYTKEAIIALVMDVMGQDIRLGPLTWCNWIRFKIYKLFLFLIRWMPGFESFLNARTIRLFNIILKLNPVERVKRLNILAARLDAIKT